MESESQGRLRIRVLGTFSLMCAGRSVETVNTARMQSLLTFLVLHRNSAQPRQQLAFLLWPDSSEAQARTNLRNLIHLLRQALPCADDFLRVDTRTVQWRPDSAFTLDAVEFENAIATNTLEAAFALYQGDLLPDCYDDWIIEERERLHQLYTQLLGRLIARAEEQRAYRTAIQYAQQLLRHEPLDEEAWQRMMRLHALDGDRAGVVRTYNTCVTILNHELSVEPSAETQACYENTLKMPVSSEPSASRLSSPTLTPQRHNLPRHLTGFIGREREKNQVKELVLNRHLVTLMGAGGIGKTRLAIAAAEDLIDTFPDGVWWLDLAPLADPALLPQTLASVLGLREVPPRLLLEVIASHVRERNLLIVLDNCEHLVSAVGEIVEALLCAARQVHLLVTSRESLRLAGETTWRVPSLSLPPPLSLENNAETMKEVSISALLQYEGVRLFVERAATALPTFALTQQNASSVEQICRRLDGIPLAIELAAARVKLLTIEQIADRLADSFRLLTRGSRSALPRHQTLQETMDWSYRLLSTKEQILLRRLAVFVGGFTLLAAESVCSDQELVSGEILDILSSLQDKSLVEVQQRNDEARNYLLETVRQYARVKLNESGEAPRMRDRHLEFFVRLAEQANPMARDTWLPVVTPQFQIELDNLRAALEWSVTAAERAPIGLKLAMLMAGFLRQRGDFSGSRDRLGRLLEQTQSTTSPCWRAAALHSAAITEMLLGNLDVAVSLGEQSVVLARELGDEARLAEALYTVGGIHWLTHLSAVARPILEESLAICRRLGDSIGLVYVLSDLGRVVYALGDRMLGRAYLEECLQIAREKNWGFVVARSAYSLGDIVRHEGDFARAKSLIKEALTMLDAAINWGLPFVTESLAHVVMAEGAASRAATLFGAAERVYHIVGLIRVPLLQHEYDQAIAALRVTLGEDIFAKYWTEGHALTVPQVFELALKSC